jgi:CheY-like chemotaxis protein
MDRKKVLVADDDPVFVLAVRSVLETRYVVRSASSGSETLKMVEEDPPDLIVLDVMMDYMSEGFDVARKLRSDPKTQAIPVILLTGVDQRFDYRLEQDESWVPCNRFLEKPIEPEKLLAEVSALID